MEQRLADRRASDAEGFHQLPLRGQWIARRIVAAGNLLLKPLGDFLVELSLTNGGFRHWYTCEASVMLSSLSPMVNQPWVKPDKPAKISLMGGADDNFGDDRKRQRRFG